MEGSHGEIGDYIVRETLGNGSYGKVKLAEHKITHEKVAIKIIKKEKMESMPDFKVKIKREIALMRLLDHPHILKMIDLCESARHMYLIIEYAENRELFDFLVERGSLSVDLALRIFRQIIYGLEFLHSHSICHRDIKPENILLDAKDNIKIADFGFARWMKDNTAVTACGSPHYTAPEIILGLPYDGRASDIWSCGVVFYTLMCGRLPFDEPTVRKLLAKVRSGKFIMPNFPQDIKDIIQRMLTVDPTKRITLSEIKEHPAFRAGLPVLYKCPTPLPVPSMLPPIDTAEIPPEALEILRDLGFEDQAELIRELESTENTVPKEFCFMLERRISFDALPFDDLPAPPPDRFILEPTPPAFDQLDAPYISPIGVSPTPTPSLSVYSVVERTMLGELPGMPVEQRRTIESVVATQEAVMCAVQQMLDRRGARWVHPDEGTLLAREPGLDVVVSAIQLEEDLIAVEACLAGGSTDAFEAFVAEVKEVVDQVYAYA